MSPLVDAATAPLAAIVADATGAAPDAWAIGELRRIDAMRFAAASHDDVALSDLAAGSDELPALYLSSVLDWDVGTPTGEMRTDGLSDREAPFVGTRQVRLVHGGQRLRWQRPVRIGETHLTATRRVVRAALREGRSGALAVLDFETAVTDGSGTTAMTWAETILALPPIEGAAPDRPTADPSAEPFVSTCDRSIAVGHTPVDLLRFSAATANTHRIHVDSAFAAAEGFAGPVVQSSLHGVAVLRAAQHAAGVAGTPIELSWRNLSPAVAGQPLLAAARPDPEADTDTDTAQCVWLADEWIDGGARTATGQVVFAAETVRRADRR